MKNRFLSVLVALALCLGVFVRPANASAAYGQAALTGANLQIYNILKEEVTNVANGAGDSSVFEINTADMGISYINGVLRGVDTAAIVRALAADCPYELYWFDKTAGFTSGYSGTHRDGMITTITFQFSVSQDYAVTNAAGTAYYPYQPDPAKTGAAAAVAKNAQAVVERSRGLSDYDKLTAYRDYICDQVSYNQAAASGRNYPYGDPWQLIYVFDNNPNTNVVCEGYAKAFQYLCDLTSFSGSVDCYTVTGRATSDHMWNIVRINGQSYLADVTNCDAEGSGSYGGLFLAGAPNATGNGCSILIPRHDLGNGYYIREHSMSYTYDMETKVLYDSAILILAASDYTPDSTTPVDSDPVTPVGNDPVNPAPVDSNPVNPAPVDSAPPVGSVPPTFTDVPAGQWYANAVSWAVENEITNGTGNGEFSPGQNCTQEQILTFLYRAARGAGTAASAGDMAAAVNWAREWGIIDASFDGKAPCTRATAVSYIWQALGMPPAGSSSFSDVPANAPYAAAVDWAVEIGVTDGTGNGQFSPGRVCDRGTIVTFLHRACDPEARLK